MATVSVSIVFTVKTKYWTAVVAKLVEHLTSHCDKNNEKVRLDKWQFVAETVFLLSCPANRSVLLHL